MILIDALYINDGGGKILLDYLISELEKTEKKVFYLLDERVKGNIPIISTNNDSIFLRPSMYSRHIFYSKNKHKFITVLCFGNIPPSIKLSASVYTYFHQLLFLKIDGDFSFLEKLKYQLKISVLNALKKNTDYWLVQTDAIKERFKAKYKVSETKMKIMPFYPPIKYIDAERKENTYLYVSNATPHKNHKRLIEAFSQFYKQTRTGKLILTVSEEYTHIYSLIEEKQRIGIPIENVGFVTRADLGKLYSMSEYLIFPSLAESFGLGIVEAIEGGCKVIGADLPYMHAVCKPSIIFNPNYTEDIFKAFLLSLQANIKTTEQKIQNNISQLLTLLN